MYGSVLIDCSKSSSLQLKLDIEEETGKKYETFEPTLVRKRAVAGAKYFFKVRH